MSPEASLPEYKKEGGRDGRRERERERGREREREREGERESGWVASIVSFSVMFLFTGR